jgi:hypothetical protein
MRACQETRAFRQFYFVQERPASFGASGKDKIIPSATNSISLAQTARKECPAKNVFDAPRDVEIGIDEAVKSKREKLWARRSGVSIRPCLGTPDKLSGGLPRTEAGVFAIRNWVDASRQSFCAKRRLALPSWAFS